MTTVVFYKVAYFIKAPNGPSSLKRICDWVGTVYEAALVWHKFSTNFQDGLYTIYVTESTL